MPEHAERFHQLETQLSQHVEYCRAQFDQLRISMEHNSDNVDSLIRAQEECTRAVADLAKATSGVVATYNNVNGAIAVGVTIQRFGLWLIKWPVIGVGCWAMMQYAGEFLQKMFNHS